MEQSEETGEFVRPRRPLEAALNAATVLAMVILDVELPEPARKAWEMSGKSKKQVAKMYLAALQLVMMDADYEATQEAEPDDRPSLYGPDGAPL